jgi:hypothetical protein
MKFSEEVPPNQLKKSGAKSATHFRRRYSRHFSMPPDVSQTVTQQNFIKTDVRHEDT